jgi:hypothetical protein
MSDYLEQRRAEVERHRENSARGAQAFAVFTATGQGSVEFPDVVDFGLTFVDQPMVSVGVVIDADELRDALELDEDADLPIPVITGFVTDWDRDDRDYYTGAWCAASVYFPPAYLIPTELEPSFDMHFTFTATAIKDIPLGGES